MGSAVCEVLSENKPAKVLRIGTEDVFGQSGTAKALLDYYGLTAEKIADRITKKMETL